jgi:hypothetical protein
VREFRLWFAQRTQWLHTSTADERDAAAAACYGSATITASEMLTTSAAISAGGERRQGHEARL